MLDDEEARQATPFGLRRYAQEYLQVAEDSLESHRARLPEPQRHHTHIPFAVYYNFLHAIELGLKAYMAHTGSNLRQLRNVGHDLLAALVACVENGLHEACPNVTDLMLGSIEGCSEMYKAKQFEYIRIGHVHLEHIDQVAAAAKVLISDLTAIDMTPKAS